MKPRFKIGEKVRTEYGHIGEVVDILERSDYWEEKFMYLVEYEEKFLWIKLKTKEWHVSQVLQKFMSK